MADSSSLSGKTRNFDLLFISVSLVLLASNASVYYFLSNSKTNLNQFVDEAQFIEIELRVNKTVDGKLSQIDLDSERNALNLNEDVNEKVIKIRKNLGKQSSSVKEELDLLKNDVEKLKEFIEDMDLESTIEELEQKIMDVDMNKDNTTFIYEPDNMMAFFEERPGEEIRSEYFFCKGIAWYVVIRVGKDFDGKRWVDTLLKANNYLDDDDSGLWLISADLSIRYHNLLTENRTANSEHREITFDGDQKSFGTGFWIDQAAKQIFVKDDKIKIEFELKVNKFVRTG